MNSIAFKYYKNDILHKLKQPISVAIGLAGVVFLLLPNKSRATSLLMQSFRIFNKKRVLNILLKYNLLSNEILQSQYSKASNIEGAASRSIIIKYPSIKEGEIKSKGIIIITFTSTFGFYLREINIDLLSKYFHIVLEPSWSGYLDADIIGWTHKTSENIYVQSSELQDRVLLNGLNTNLKPVSFGASDWVDFRFFSPVSVEKCYDSVYVANMNPIKRIVRYLKAIKNIARKIPNYRGCLICAGWGGEAVGQLKLKELVAELCINENVEIMFSLNKEQLKTVLSQSKVNVLLSFKEGSNRSMYESMFVDIPVICLVENIGVNKSYINEFTGILVFDVDLECALIEFREKWWQFSPRVWALENISPIKTTEKLLSVISHYEQVGTEHWQPKIKVNNPEVCYFHDQDVDCLPLNLEVLSLFLSGRVDAQITSEMESLEGAFFTSVAVMESYANSERGSASPQ